MKKKNLTTLNNATVTLELFEAAMHTRECNEKLLCINSTQNTYYCQAALFIEICWMGEI